MKSFVVKMANTPRVLFYTVIGSWVLAALGFVILESANPLDALYWSMTTMSTVGYGDFSPASDGGKVWTMLFQAWSIFVIVPCAVVNIIDAVRIDEGKFSHHEQEWVQDSLNAIANANGVTLPEPPADY